ncbi:MAG: sterol desaturase family protein, partial [Chlamydiia bacterium]|nr:sterol desaturase family protein [Chlamydiia bacterium]
MRLGSFLLVFVLLATAESLAPRRPTSPRRLRRWSSNLGILGLNSIVVRLVMPIMAIDMAWMAEARGWGLFAYANMSYIPTVIAGVVLLDFAIYCQHVCFHFVPLFWRLHRMHHADTEFDVSLGGRFHPLEILLSMGIKVGVVAAFGIPALAVLIFEVLLNATSMFNHSNLKLPLRLDAAIRCVIVTPDMHRVHHSTHPSETNSNFGFNFSLWDRICKTYRPQP